MLGASLLLLLLLQVVMNTGFTPQHVIAPHRQVLRAGCALQRVITPNRHLSAAETSKNDGVDESVQGNDTDFIALHQRVHKVELQPHTLKDFFNSKLESESRNNRELFAARGEVLTRSIKAEIGEALREQDLKAEARATAVFKKLKEQDLKQEAKAKELKEDLMKELKEQDIKAEARAQKLKEDLMKELTHALEVSNIKQQARDNELDTKLQASNNDLDTKLQARNNDLDTKLKGRFDLLEVELLIVTLILGLCSAPDSIKSSLSSLLKLPG